MDRLLKLEKACRLVRARVAGFQSAAALTRVARVTQANQWDVTIKAALQIVSLSFECGDWDALNTNLVLLSKRRSQHQKVHQGEAGRGQRGAR